MRCGCQGNCSCALDDLDTQSVNLTITGTGAAGLDPYIISADVRIDTVTVGNQLSVNANGLLVPAAAPEEFIAPFFRTGVLSAPTIGVSRFKFPFAATIINVTAAVGTAPTGADIVLDVNKNGVTVFTTQANRPRILAGTFQESVDAVPDIVSVVNDEYLTVDVDAVGSVVAGSDLTVFVRYSRP